MSKQSFGSVQDVVAPQLLMTTSQNLKQFQTLLSRYCDWRSMLAIKEINSLQDQLSAAVNKQELFGAAADILQGSDLSMENTL